MLRQMQWNDCSLHTLLYQILVDYKHFRVWRKDAYLVDLPLEPPVPHIWRRLCMVHAREISWLRCEDLDALCSSPMDIESS